MKTTYYLPYKDKGVWVSCENSSKDLLVLNNCGTETEIKSHQELADIRYEQDKIYHKLFPNLCVCDFCRLKIEQKNESKI
jgi:hypothetical protein